MAYNTQLAAALSGATTGQLSRWRRPTAQAPAALVPEHGLVGGRWLYSFRDLVALRTFVLLRETTSMQLIRRSVATLDRFEDREHLSTYTLYRLDRAGKTVDLEWAHEGSVVSLGRGGQTRLPLAPMQDVLGAFEVSLHGQAPRVVPDLYSPHEHVSVDPEVRSGYPVIAGSRVPFDQVATLIEDGYPASAIGTLYPSVDPEAALAAHEWWLTFKSASTAA